MIPHISLGALSTAWTFFFQIKIKKNQYVVIKKINIKKKIPLNKQFTNFYSYHNLIQEKYKQYVYDDHKLI